MNDLLKKSLHAERHVLENGLTVLLLEDHHLPLISSQTVFKVGSRNEHDGITGISHLFEHMMFNGSRHYPAGEFDRLLESSGGYSNAYTSRDLTVYYETFTPKLLQTVLTLNADRMGWLSLDEENLESERQVVMEERRLRTDNSISGQLEEALYANAYLAHPYRTPVIGWMSDIEKITLEDCQAFYRTYYAPDNAILALAGDFDCADALRRIRDAYEAIPAQPPPQAVRTVEPPQQGERRIALCLPAQLPAFLAAYHVPEMYHDDVYALDVLQVILTDGDSSRLMRKFIHDRDIAVQLYSDFVWRKDASLMSFYIQVAPQSSVQQAERLLYGELGRLQSRGAASREVQKARNIISANLARGLKSIEGRAGKLAVFEALFDTYEEIYQLQGRYEAVTPERVRDVAARYLAPENRTVLTLIPTPGHGNEALDDGE